jgi:hypothetical protein
MRLPIALAAAALIVATATLHLHVTPVKLTPPVPALLYPYGDASGGQLDQNKTLYVNGRYATIVAFGRVALSTNTSGWYVSVAKYRLPPIGASRVAPGVGEYITAPLDNGAFLNLYNYDNEYGVAALMRGGLIYAWAAKILNVSGYYIWYPTRPTLDIYYFVVELARPPIYLLVPRRDYVTFSNHTVCIYADYFNGTYNIYGHPIWSRKSVCFGFNLYADFRPLDLGYVDGLEWRDGVYIYWPVVVAYVGEAGTYLRAEGR